MREGVRSTEERARSVLDTGPRAWVSLTASLQLGTKGANGILVFGLTRVKLVVY